MRERSQSISATKRSGAKDQYGAARARYTVTRHPGKRIRAVMAHGNPLREVSGEGFPRELAEGEATITRGNATSWTILETVAADDWPRVAGIAAEH